MHLGYISSSYYKMGWKLNGLKPFLTQHPTLPIVAVQVFTSAVIFMTVQNITFFSLFALDLGRQ